MPHNPDLYRTYNVSIRIPEIVQNSSHYDGTSYSCLVLPKFVYENPLQTLFTYTAT